MKNPTLGAVCATLFVAASTPATAAIITVNSDVANGLYADTTVSGTFDLTSYLTTPMHNAPYIINSASIDFGFSDNGDTLISQGYNYNNYTYNLYDPEESVMLDLSGESAAGATGYYYHSVITGTRTVSCGFLCTRTYDEYTSTSGYSGLFDITQALTGSGLAAISATGMLDFTAEITGSLNLDYATLTIDVTPNPVPVPAAVWLFGSSLLGLLGVARRKKDL